MRLQIATNPSFPTVADPAADWFGFLGDLAGELGRPARCVELSFIDDARMRRLNRDWRGKDAPTDVLSFSYGELGDGTLPAAEDPEGEILISVETAARQAAAAGHSLAEEVSVLVIHGLCHILGMDHEDDSEAAAMAAVEAPFRRRIAEYFGSGHRRR
jgi:probable rRNA maturation factor